MAANRKQSNDRPVSLKKRWPTKYDLLAWWIHYKVGQSPLHDLDDPDAIKKWLHEFVEMTELGVHVELYGFCKEFRIEFKSPRDYSSGGVGMGRTSG